MSSLVLRLAGPLQSWSGYRLALNKNAVAPTGPMPRKSAVNGLIGAAVGSRDLTTIGALYDLHVRVERSNPVAEDYQTISPIPAAARAVADRHEKIRTAKVGARIDTNRAGGSFTTLPTRKDYLAHSEFIVALHGDAVLAQEWEAALREPVYMPYLGRKSCPPSFPFLLGVWPGSPADLWPVLPTVAGHDERAPEPGDATLLSTYRVRGDYDAHDAEPTGPTTAPLASLGEQLTWAKENLR